MTTTYSREDTRKDSKNNYIKVAGLTPKYNQIIEKITAQELVKLKVFSKVSDARKALKTNKEYKRMSKVLIQYIKSTDWSTFPHMEPAVNQQISWYNMSVIENLRDTYVKENAESIAKAIQRYNYI